MTLWKSYQALSSNYKLVFGAGMVVWGVVGLTMTDTIEEKLGLTPSEEDLKRLPKIQVIDRSAGPTVPPFLQSRNDKQ
ncbi:hypothetical protein B0H66DRAFT_602953 [Apodospora peruviana]|uniref:Uncharacterized protein n=1 Tax=Apodospora peruviana TaxID=516989 RepID=A0AAE0M3Z4_9PEZI|nr:hypothetical protein B0H66DRAFT_602953 [Apodospora peruviana]